SAKRAYSRWSKSAAVSRREAAAYRRARHDSLDDMAREVEIGGKRLGGRQRHGGVIDDQRNSRLVQRAVPAIARLQLLHRRLELAEDRLGVAEDGELADALGHEAELLGGRAPRQHRLDALEIQ